MDHGQVDHAGGLVAAAAELAKLLGVEVEGAGQLRAPLVQQRLAVRQDQCRQAAGGEDRAAHHGLAGSGWGDQSRPCLLVLTLSVTTAT